MANSKSNKSVSFAPDTIFETRNRESRCFARKSKAYAPGKYSCASKHGWENTSRYSDYLYVLQRLFIRGVYYADKDDENSAFRQALQMAKTCAKPNAVLPPRSDCQVQHSRYFKPIWEQVARHIPWIDADEEITAIYRDRISQADSVVILVSKDAHKFLAFMPVIPDHHNVWVDHIIALRESVPPGNRGKPRVEQLIEMRELEELSKQLPELALYERAGLLD